MSTMTLDQACGAVERIRKIAADGDDEDAHIHEDRLYMALLQAISDGACDDPAACAREALKAVDIRFYRWYA